MGFAVYRAEQVRELQDYRGCIGAMRRAMAGLSKDSREQSLRGINSIREGRLDDADITLCKSLGHIVQSLNS